MAQEPGRTREDAAEQLMQDYRDDLADAHANADRETLDEMAVNFCGALLLEMEHAGTHDDYRTAAMPIRGTHQSPRHRVIETIGRLMAAVAPRN